MVCKQKSTGGLGLRDPEVANRVLSAKIWWRWVTHTREPWEKLWHNKYAKGWQSQHLIYYDENPLGSPIW